MRDADATQGRRSQVLREHVGQGPPSVFGEPCWRLQEKGRGATLQSAGKEAERPLHAGQLEKVRGLN